LNAPIYAPKYRNTGPNSIKQPAISEYFSLARRGHWSFKDIGKADRGLQGNSGGSGWLRCRQNAAGSFHAINATVRTGSGTVFIFN
jgi:hypothetical protein